MSSRGKSKQARSNGLKELDRISELPETLICHILDHLSTKEAVSTSVLSTRWRNPWLWIPNVELNSRNFQDINAFVGFGDRFFNPIRVPSIRKLDLVLGRNASTLDDESYFTSWIEAAIKRKIQHLHVRCAKEVHLTNNPLRLYSCETLVCLRLCGVILDEEVFDVLPCLKTMCLEKNMYPNEATLEKLISSCPVLESLDIVASDIDENVFRVHSRSLKMLTIERGRIVLPWYDDDDHHHDDVPGVVIDAPLLSSLSIDDIASQNFVVSNMESNAKLDISLSFGLGIDCLRRWVPSRRGSIGDFLVGISRVREIKISSLTFKEQRSDYSYDFDDLQLPPVQEMKQISLPHCLLSSLELVCFEVPISGLAAEMKLIKYFLKNSANLKKLIISLDSYSRKDDILKELLESSRGSTECELVVE
ncbi:unnamed protein product [Microthlaspi erraticum]|uniref:F-box domain-containing protein n=1 Tax=Microthlaspi erraticum TaxID=1685480 RepID=A0A6D2J5X3_9BRAS|nr:unnamed protein product [Microthlaspi erraticum]